MTRWQFQAGSVWMATSRRLRRQEWYTHREAAHETRRQSYPSYERAGAVPFASNGALVVFPGAAHATLQ